MKNLSLSLLLAALVAGTAFAQGSPQDKPGKPGVALAFEDAAVTASGLTPGRPVIWFGVEHRIDAEYSGEMAQRYEVGTAAADGTAASTSGGQSRRAPTGWRWTSTAATSWWRPPAATGSPSPRSPRGWGWGTARRPTSCSTNAPF